MINNLKDYKEIQHCYYDVLDNIDKINMYQEEMERVFEKMDDISESDIFAVEELFVKLSPELQEMFLRSHGDELKYSYYERSQEDIEMIEKYDPERAKKLKKNL